MITNFCLLVIFRLLCGCTSDALMINSWIQNFKQVISQIPNKKAFQGLGLSFLLITNSNSMTNADDNLIKLMNLPSNRISEIVKDDIKIRQALITADFTRSIYSENCQFQDEIDIYPIDKYVTGTKALFNEKLSHVDLTSDVQVDNKKVFFRFKEDLAFNIPFNPIVTLSGSVELTRGDDGLISYSRERWDQSVKDVLLTTHFNK
eukprot:gene15081-20291_t